MTLLCTLIRKRQVRQCEAKQNSFDSHPKNPSMPFKVLYNCVKCMRIMKPVQLLVEVMSSAKKKKKKKKKKSTKMFRFH